MVCFLVEGAHAHDLATLLDLEGVAVRSGHHCAHPLMQFFGVPATCRASLAFYNTHDEIDAFIAALLEGAPPARLDCARPPGSHQMTDEIAGLLREIRDQQRAQLEGQAEALAVQRQQFDLYTQQLGRVERINDRAEAIQRPREQGSEDRAVGGASSDAAGAAGPGMALDRATFATGCHEPSTFIP